MFACLAIPCLPVQIAEAFDPALSAAHSTVLVMLVDRGLDRLLGTLPRDQLTNILCTILLSLSEEQRMMQLAIDETAECRSRMRAEDVKQEQEARSAGVTTGRVGFTSDSLV